MSVRTYLFISSTTASGLALRRDHDIYIEVPYILSVRPESRKIALAWILPSEKLSRSATTARLSKSKGSQPVRDVLPAKVVVRDS